MRGYISAGVFLFHSTVVFKEERLSRWTDQFQRTLKPENFLQEKGEEKEKSDCKHEKDFAWWLEAREGL